MSVNIHNVEFVSSAVSPDALPNDRLPQIVFVGRSNVGKSSVLNTLLNRKSIARVSSSPGKTANINLFRVDNRFYLVDLPGYGYAKVSNAEKKRWSHMMEGYFSVPQRVTLAVCIVDIRHKPTNDDIMMKEYLSSARIPFIVLANKVDKLKKSEVAGRIDDIREALSLDADSILIPFSSVTRDGKNEALAAILAAAD